MKYSHMTKAAMTFALALSVMSGCNNAVEEKRMAQTPDTKKVINTKNGYITGEPVAYRTENNSVNNGITGKPVGYYRNQNYYRPQQDFANVPDTNMMDGIPNFDQNTGMLNRNPDFNQTTPSPGAPPTPETAQPSPPKQTPSTFAGDAMVQQVVQLTNEQRRKNGVPDLQADTTLTNMAQEKAQDMLENNYFSHTSPTYGSPFDMMKTFGISYRTAGENIAKGQQSAQQVVNDWMNSPGHRANILNGSFTHIGVGHTTSEGYWTQEFIAK
ncbi:putative YkwD family protein [Bacillus fengqiuensis]|nr:putative YkwD family protein [Bacillus fengqiuensis]